MFKNIRLAFRPREGEGFVVIVVDFWSFSSIFIREEKEWRRIPCFIEDNCFFSLLSSRGPHLDRPLLGPLMDQSECGSLEKDQNLIVISPMWPTSHYQSILCENLCGVGWGSDEEKGRS